MSCHRCADGGFTLVELLVALALAAVMTVLLSSGVFSIRENWTRVDSAANEDLEPALQRLGSILRNARVAYQVKSSTQPAELLFQGKLDQLTFVTLSEGYVLQGGLIRLQVTTEPRATGKRVTLTASVYRASSAEMQAGDPLVLFDNVKSLSFRYYGAEGNGSAHAWQPEWTGRRTLPWYVEIRVQLDGGPRERTIVVPVELRHGFGAGT